MKILLLLFSLLTSSLSFAQDIIISDLKTRPALQAGYPTTIYLNIENTSDQLDYLTDVKIIGYPNAIVTINKTVIEKNVARVIHIDRLAIPQHSKVSLSPRGIYIVATKLPVITNYTISHVIPDENEVFDRGSCEDKLLRSLVLQRSLHLRQGFGGRAGMTSNSVVHHGKSHYTLQFTFKHAGKLDQIVK